MSESGRATRPRVGSSERMASEHREPPTAPLVGVVMGSRSDWETMRHAAEILDALGIAHEAQGRLGPPDARPALPVRPRGRGAGPGGPDRRGRGRGAPAGDARGDRRSCRCWACRSRARCCGGSIRSCRSSRCRKGSRSGRSPSAPPGAANAALLAAAILARTVPGGPRGPGRLPAGADRRGRGVAVMSRPAARRPPPARDARRDRRRPARPDVPPGRAADGLPRRSSSARPPTPRRRRSRTGRSSPRPTTCRRSGRSPSRPTR